MTDFAAHLDHASAIVRTWPEWKRNLLGRTEAQGDKEDDMTDNELYEQIAREQSWPDGHADAAVLRAERDAARAEAEAAQNRICEADAEVDRTLSELNRVVTLHMESMAENIAALKEQHAEVRNLKAELARVQAEAAAMMKCIGDAVHTSYTGDSDDVRAELLPAIETTAGLDLLERLDKAEAAIHAIEDALVKTGASPEPNNGDWKQAINALIDWHVRVSHDPRVNGSEQVGAE